MFGTAQPARSTEEVVRKPTLEEIAAKQRVGIVIHDNQNAMTEGWAFLTDREPFRVRALYDLPNDALWISSGDFQDFRKIGGSQYHNVRRTGYLGLKLTELAVDLGIRIDGGYAIRGGVELVKFVENAVRRAIVLYRLEEPLRQLQDDTLVTSLTKAMPPPPPSSHLSGKLGSAYQSWSSCNGHYVENSIKVRLRFARLPYAQWLLSQSVPENSWNLFYDTRGFNHDEVVEGNCRPCLIEGVLEFDQTNAAVAELIAYGTGGPSSSRSKRAWMTDVEYRWISSFARIHVRQYLQSTDYMPLPMACRLPEQLSADPMLYHSVSSELLAYAHWQALAAAKYSRAAGAAVHDIFGTWLRAYDRQKCFEAAFVLHNHGFSVGGYGSGSVLIKAPREKLKELEELASSLGFAYPSWNALLQEFGYASPDFPD